MKRMYFLTVFAVMALAGCVKNEVQSIDDQKNGVKIAFESPFLYDNMTKGEVHGEISTTLYPQEEKFIIFASQHDGDFAGWPSNKVSTPNSTENGICDFHGTEIEYDSSFDAWIPTYDDNGSTGYYYWPMGKKLSFAAMSPSDLHNSAVVTYDNTGLKIDGFENPDAGEQFDLLFARRTMNHTASDMTNHAGEYSGIPISFQHALSSIHFSIDKETLEQEVFLKKIQLTNVRYLGDFAENIDESKGLEYIIDQDADNTVNPVWTVEDPMTDYVPFDAKSYGSIPFPVNPQYVSSIVNNLETDGEDLQDLFSSSLLIVPQEIDDNATLIIDYEISGVSQQKVYPLKGLATITEGGIPSGKTGTVVSWDRGHKYTYRIHYSSASEMKDIIYFSPSVEGWTDVQVIQITL